MGDLGLGQIFFGQVVLALPGRTVDHGNVVGLGITAQAAAEPAGEPHEIGVLERLVRSGERPPPQPEPAGKMPVAEIRVQNDPVDAVVAAAQ